MMKRTRKKKNNLMGMRVIPRRKPKMKKPKMIEHFTKNSFLIPTIIPSQKI
jgi:hypothetical protein